MGNILEANIFVVQELRMKRWDEDGCCSVGTLIELSPVKPVPVEGTAPAVRFVLHAVPLASV